MKYFILSISLLLLAFNSYADEGRLLRYPNACKDKICFIYAGDVYTVSINGGQARKLTNSPGIEEFPRFSPDGTKIAFAGEYDGNKEIYIMPAEGGEPKRLTYSDDLPDMKNRERLGPPKIIMQWTSDSKQILYRSRHNVWNSMTGKLYLVSTDGGLPTELPLPKAGFSSLSPDGNKLAFNRVFREYRTWKRYRGGQADDIWIFDFNTKKTEKITSDTAQDIIPIWWQDKIYFLSDRDHTMNLFCYNLSTKETKKITQFDEFDVKFPSWGSDYICFENGGYIYKLDPRTDKYDKVNIEVNDDNVWSRTENLNVSDRTNTASLSPDGSKLLLSARGEIFTVPAEQGVTKNITGATSGIYERNAQWSPDGKHIAFISDKTGETEIYIMDPDGSNVVQISSNASTYRYFVKWSPDSKKLLCCDKENKLYFYDINSKKETLVRQSKFGSLQDFNWSPDSKYIAFSDELHNDISAIYMYSLEDGSTKQLSNNFFDSHDPAFSDNGNYLYFVSGRTFRPTVGEFEWNYSYSNTSTIYGYALKKDVPNPFLVTDDTTQAKVVKKAVAKPSNKGKKGKQKKNSKDEQNSAASSTYALDDVESRIFEFPVPAANYLNLSCVKGKLYFARTGAGSELGIYDFDFDSKKINEVANLMTNYDISGDGKKILLRSNMFVNNVQRNVFYIEPLHEKIRPEKAVDVSSVNFEVNKKEEWKEVFNDCWRQMRDFFYDPNMHGVDWKAIHDRYAQLLPYVNHRADLTYVIGEMIGELCIGHAYVGGGDKPEVATKTVGLLGCNFEYDAVKNAYKITNIYDGRNWDKQTYSPLTEAGIDVQAGDYLLEVNGKHVSKEDTPYKLLNNLSEKYVNIKIQHADENDTKVYTVKTISNEADLIYYNWVEKNRKFVDSVTQGRVGYIHIPDMSFEGLNEFVKYFYPQLNKEALIIDDRYNGGGNVSPMIIERLRRILVIAKHSRNQEVITTNPSAVMTGPMVCLINQQSMSDGDLFPYQFQTLGLGKVIGKRSWGGVIGISGSLPLLDGGYLNKPEHANFGANGQWVLENTGVHPDIDIENDPYLEYCGKDEQLEKAIAVVIDEIKTNTKPQIPTLPTFPDKSK